MKVLVLFFFVIFAISAFRATHHKRASVLWLLSIVAVVSVSYFSLRIIE